MEASALGEDHPTTALMRVNLGQLLSKDTKVAKPHFLRAYKSLRQAVGIMHLWVAFSLSGLATGYLREESFPQACVLFQNPVVAKIRGRSPGERFATRASLQVMPMPEEFTGGEIQKQYIGKLKMLT